MDDQSTRQIRRAREQFLSDGDIGPDLARFVRPDILQSWRRSRLSGASMGVDVLPFQAEVHGDSALCQAAEPVLSRLAEQLSGLAAGVLLSDRNARILRRWAPETSILPKMDRIQSDSGSSGSEELVGTNGIGTIVEDRKPHMVVGAEHFAEVLVTFTCVGAPIFNPLSRRFEGVVTLNTDANEASPLLTSLIASTAQQIESRLLDLSSRRERALLDAFLIANRSGRPIAVVGHEVLLAGPQVNRMLRSIDQATIWHRIREEVSDGQHGEHIIVVQSQDNPASLACTPVRLDGKLIGALVEVIMPGAEPPAIRVSPGHGRPKTWQAAEDRLPGGSPAWQAVIRQAAELRAGDVPLLLTGEAGTGKLELARTMFADSPAVIIDCFTAPADDPSWPLRITGSLPSGGVLILRHIDVLSPAVARALSACLDDITLRHPSVRICGTALPAGHSVRDDSQQRLQDQLGVVTIELPSLRDRREDIPLLVRYFNQRYGGLAPLRFSQGAIQALSRAPWPGNVRQLENLVRGLAATGRVAEVTADLLPGRLGAYSTGRSLTKMEQLELDAILQMINRAEGNKVETARLLGISRSTLYRKMRHYHLDPERSFL
jgi:transcriptional regulator of acetoin/glycerol metabolism